MNPWELIYVLAGVGALVGIVGAIVADAFALQAWYEAEGLEHWIGGGVRPPAIPHSIAAGPRYIVGLAVLVVLWLAAAVLR